MWEPSSASNHEVGDPASALTLRLEAKLSGSSSLEGGDRDGKKTLSAPSSVSSGVPHGILAMHKVVGSSPIIRFIRSGCCMTVRRHEIVSLGLERTAKRER